MALEAPDDEVVPVTLARTWLKVNGTLLTPTCQVSTQLKRPSLLLNEAK
jgi:hypothetical protein